MLFRRIVLYALLVGASAGLLLTAVQWWQVIPIIHSAERFEGEAATAPAHEIAGHQHTGHERQQVGHEHSADDWEPAAGVERTSFTVLAKVLTAIGFALVLLPVMVVSTRPTAGSKINWSKGLFWGAAGYAVFYLAPALGLPPEVPGAVAAPLEARQLWWLFAVTCTAAGLAGAAFGKSPWRWAALGLLVLPHVVGAPYSPVAAFSEHSAAAAAELERLADQFIGATAIANGVFWLALGLVSIWAVERIGSASINVNRRG